MIRDEQLFLYCELRLRASQSREEWQHEITSSQSALLGLTILCKLLIEIHTADMQLF